MKIVIFVLIFLLIVFTSTFTQIDCNIKTAKQALPPRIFYEQTIDGPNQPVVLTRFIHNKIGIFGSEFGKCYLENFGLDFVYKNIGLLGLIFWLFFVYKVMSRPKYPALFCLLVLPLFSFFGLSGYILFYSYMLFAIIGLVLVLKLI